MMSQATVKPKSNDIIEVEWWDACSLDMWMYREDVLGQYESKPGKLSKTVGYFGHYNKNNIVVFQAVNAGQVGNAWVIPKGMIKSVSIVKVATDDDMMENDDDIDG